VDAPFRSKSNHRHSSKRAARAAWGRQAGFAEEITLLTKTHRPPTWDLGDEHAPLSTRPIVVAVCVASTTIDAGNLTKTVLDAAQATVYWDDASVRFDAALVDRSGSRTGGRVGFARLPADATVGDIAAAGIALTSSITADLP